jgi:hypothetical protein
MVFKMSWALVDGRRSHQLWLAAGAHGLQVAGVEHEER